MVETRAGWLAIACLGGVSFAGFGSAIPVVSAIC